jgi:acyl-homoserine lactone acylase PvdQ
VLRRQGTGTLAELFGEGSLGSDVQSRLIFGPAERRAELFAAATQQVQDMLTAHALGINAWIDEASASGQLPIEYAVFGVEPRPWTIDRNLHGRGQQFRLVRLR